MKSIRIYIPLDALDAYIYFGYLFVVFKDATMRALPLARIFNELSEQQPNYEGILKLALLRNDWLTNYQTAAYFSIKDARKKIIECWNECAEMQHVVNFSDFEDWKFLYELPSMPIYDLRLYALRVYIAHRNGIHEGYLDIDKKGTLGYRKGLEKVFDTRTISISAKSGELMFSSDGEGLFHGTLWNGEQRTLWNGEQRTKVREKSYAKKSLRTGWSGFDVLNYDSQSHFSYLQNRTEIQETRSFRYSNQDETSEKRRILELASSTYDMHEMMRPNDSNLGEIQFSYNSSNRCFFVYKDGRVMSRNLRKSYVKGDTHFSKNSYELPNLDTMTQKNSSTSKIYSASIFPLGSVLEFFNRIVLVRQNEIKILEERPAISVRTFPASFRYRRIVCVCLEGGIVLHSIFPDEREIRKERIF